MGVTFHTSDALLQKIMDAAEEKCQENIRLFGGKRVLVEGGGYEKIWLETQPMGGAMYADRDLEVALNNQCLFMEHQRADGRLPGSIAVIDGEVVPQFNKFQGFCFPDPAMDMYYLAGEEKVYLEELRETLARFDAYLWARRDSDGDGCLESFCRYDTGEDNALRYGDAPDAWEAEEAPAGCAVVPMASMDFMSYSYNARKVLAEIYEIQGNQGKAEACAEAARQVADKIREYLWDDKRGALFDRDRHHVQMPVLVHNTLRAMYWGSISQEMADRFVREHLLNPEEFWTRLPLPSVAANDPLFRNVTTNNWSGQVEALTYQRAIRALENYGYYQLIPVLGRKLFTAIGPACRFVQQYDPFTGEPSLVALEGEQDAYGPAMLSVMAYAARMYGISADRDRLVWGTVAGPDSTYERSVGGDSYVLELKGDTARATLNGGLLFETGRNLRITTDFGGRILQADSYVM